MIFFLDQYIETPTLIQDTDVSTVYFSLYQGWHRIQYERREHVKKPMTETKLNT